MKRAISILSLIALAFVFTSTNAKEVEEQTDCGECVYYDCVHGESRHCCVYRRCPPDQK